MPSFMNIANKISTFRILIVPFFVACFIYYGQDPYERDYLRFLALFLFILGVISDAIDGYIARKSKQQSPAGLVLDPLGDKLLGCNDDEDCAVNAFKISDFV